MQGAPHGKPSIQARPNHNISRQLVARELGPLRCKRRSVSGWTDTLYEVYVRRLLSVDHPMGLVHPGS
jgi:hypothetical protein